jgi:hypothetical protein
VLNAAPADAGVAAARPQVRPAGAALHNYRRSLSCCICAALHHHIEITSYHLPQRADYTVVALAPGSPAGEEKLVQAGYFDKEWHLAGSDSRPIDEAANAAYQWTRPSAIKHPTVAAWLAGAGLAELAPTFIEHGYDEVPLLAQLSAEETEELAATVGMTRGHLLKFRRRCLAPAQGVVLMPIPESDSLVAKL